MVNSLRPSDAYIHQKTNRHQAAISINAGLWLIGLLRKKKSTKFESKYDSFHTRKCIWKYSSAKCQSPCCQGFNVLRYKVDIEFSVSLKFCHYHCWALCNARFQKLGKIFTSPTYRLFFNSTIISYIYGSCISNRTTFTKYCLIRWISKLCGSIKIHWVKQYLVNFTGLVDMVNATV